ncbi:MAG: CvpA family protein [Oscillospiraceae bacterium]|jgi:uncharacterized membrane protein required for colicin V production|nr:CvpA family protein [Oscillospiraceae bacterium]
MNLLLDFILLAILGWCVWRGYDKGLILAVSGILALIIAFWGANYIANTYSAQFEPALRPFVSGIVDKSVESAAKDYEAYPKGSEVQTVSENALHEMGILSGAASKLAREFSRQFSLVNYQLREAMVDRLSSLFAYVATLTIAFLLIIIAVTVVARLLNLAFTLPGLNLVNKIGGASFGFIKGIIFCLAIGWALRFFGVAIPAAVLDKTLLTKFFMDHNLLAGVFGI